MVSSRQYTVATRSSGYLRTVVIVVAIAALAVSVVGRVFHFPTSSVTVTRVVSPTKYQKLDRLEHEWVTPSHDIGYEDLVVILAKVFSEHQWAFSDPASNDLPSRAPPSC